MRKTVCELFAGVGGFRLGLEKASPEFETVWFSQWEPNKTKQWAHDCYVLNFKEDKHANDETGIDISLVDKNLIPEHNLLVGGFPCQDYSVARSLVGSQGLEGKKGVLWWQIRNTLIAKKTPFVLLENVDRLLKSPASQRGRDFGVMLACLADLGYSVEWRVLNAADYGAAQRRRRTFIFAYSNSTMYGVNKAQLMAEDVVKYDGFFANVFPIERDILREEKCYIDSSDITAVSDSFEFNFESAGYMHNGRIYTAKVVPIVEEAIPMRMILESNVDQKYYLGDNLEKWNKLKDAKRIERIAKNGHKYIFSEGKIAFPDSIDLPSRTMLTSESSLNRSTHVIEDPETGNKRLITPIEAERLQGFHDNWTSNMPEKMRYFCMGNALVVPMVERMGKTLKVIMDAEN